ncbi:MAG: response regulator [Candidatus Promineifilaceae bacterium]
MTDPATILIVEDDKALLAGIADLIEVSNIGYEVEVLTASDGTGGLSVLGEQIPDLIISDIMMPRMGGYEFLSQIRRNPKWLHIPMIFLSAKGTPDEVQEGRLSGAELYVTKPYDSDELLQLIQSQLDRAFQLQMDREQRLQLLRSNIVQVLNHEFRTPLTYVTAYYDLLADGLFIEEVDILWEYLRGIQVGATRLRRLVNDLIMVIELRTGELAAQFKRQSALITDLGDSLRVLCDRYRRENESQGLHFACQINDPVPAVYGHRDILLDACERIIDNAVKFSIHQQGGAEVRLSVDTEKDKLWIKVEDNGIGLPDSEYRQIFDLFYQHNRPILEQQGAGTGLTIARGLIELHGGHIEVASEEGWGSSFTIILPTSSNAMNGDLAYAHLALHSKPATVLLVEDELHLLEGLCDLLELLDSDYQLTVLTASNGIEALAILERQSVDLIISDIMMPSMDGYQFLKEVRRNRALIHIPFIFLTAKTERRDILRGFRSGVEEYITKPYDGQDLFDLIIAQLDRHFERQGLVQSDFEELKRGILNVLLPGLRIPLEAVSDYSQKLTSSLSTAQTDEDLLVQLTGIQAGSSQLTRLAEDFMFLAELQTGEARRSFEHRSEPSNAAAILDEVSMEYNRKNELQILNFTREMDFDIPMVMIERQLLWNCLERLIEVVSTIAVEQISRSDRVADLHPKRPIGEIILSSTTEGDYVCLSVSARETRLEAEEVNRMSALLSSSELVVLELSEHNPGLMIIKGIVDLHEGRIDAENTSDQGITFKIFLPVNTPAQTMEME